VCIYFLGSSSLSRAACRHVFSISILICRTRITPPSPFKKGSAVSALSCSGNYDPCSIAVRVFRVRAARCRGKAESNCFTPNPARPRSGPYDIFGHPFWPKEASPRANAKYCLHPAFTSGTASAGCLRPKAEFTRASGRGLRRVKNIVQDAKGMCKKNNPPLMFSVQNRYRQSTQNLDDTDILSSSVRCSLRCHTHFEN